MNILIIDIETTGFLGQKSSIVELGIVELNLNDGSKTILFDEVVKEESTTEEEVLNSWIVKNSYMTGSEILKAPLLSSFKDEIQEIISIYKEGATAFNNVFDFGFMEDRGFVFPKKLDCPMKLSTPIIKLPGKYGNYKWPNVNEAWQFFFGQDTGYIEKHRGADDAFHEADIVRELYNRGVFSL